MSQRIKKIIDAFDRWSSPVVVFTIIGGIVSTVGGLAAILYFAFQLKFNDEQMLKNQQEFLRLYELQVTRTNLIDEELSYLKDNTIPIQAEHDRQQTDILNDLKDQIKAIEADRKEDSAQILAIWTKVAEHGALLQTRAHSHSRSAP